MSADRFSYASFTVSEDVVAWEHILAQAIPLIHPLYFKRNPRFVHLGELSEPSLIDYLGVYEEGEWWALTMIELQRPGGDRVRLFLPLSARHSVKAESKPIPGILAGLEATAFELETNSTTYGLRKWIVADAFADVHFLSKVIELFLPWDGVPENHQNAYTEIHESGRGEFSFHSFSDLQLQWAPKNGVRLELGADGDVHLRYGDSYRLVFFRDLHRSRDGATVGSSDNPLGRITYFGAHIPEVLIGLLYAWTPESNG